MDQSNHKKEAIKILSRFTYTPAIPSRKEYCHIRDYIITYIILDNASRSGCISNMTLAEYDKAEVQHDGSYIISMKKHKTAATAGPAMLSIQDVIMRHLNVFVRKLRNRLPDISVTEKSPVFAGWSGKIMASSMVSGQLNTFWKTAVSIDLDQRVTATLLRKMTTTAVHSNAPVLKTPLANLKNHDVRTAECEYFLQEQKKTVAATSSQIRGHH